MRFEIMHSKWSDLPPTLTNCVLIEFNDRFSITFQIKYNANITGLVQLVLHEHSCNNIMLYFLIQHLTLESRVK